ncbi:MAG: AmmeMemoRadiSam system protein B [Candidatus Hodarchaeales archaeon]|jgi:AmmeMemoRadiSam system protein B
MTRRPHVFTRINWYDSDPEGLKNRIKWSYLHEKGPKKLPDELKRQKQSKILGIVSPHAGFSCSGPFAAHGYLALSEVDQVDTFILLGTNHTGLGEPISIFPDGDWETPLGIIPINSDLTNELMSGLLDNGIKIPINKEPEAHMYEHSIDNQLPFLQYSFSNFKLVAICLDSRSVDFETCIIIGKTLAKIIKSKNIKVIASSDFCHFLTPFEAARRDKSVIEALLDYRLIEADKRKHDLDASICGFHPILTLFSIALELKSKKPDVLIYGHSGETCGSMDSVVAYTSIRIDKTA